MDGLRRRRYEGRILIEVWRRIVIVLGLWIKDNDERKVMLVIGRKMSLIEGGNY